MIYLIVLIIFLIGTFRIEKLSSKDKKIWLILEWTILVLVAGFRYRLGGDTVSYMEGYEYLPTFDELLETNVWTLHYQPLWYVFISFCKYFSESFYFFQFIHAIITNTFIFIFIKNHTQKTFMGLMFYTVFFFPYYNMEILRASISICIFLYSFDYLVNKQWVKYFLCCLIAWGFHAQALILLLFPLCHFTQKNSRRQTIVIFSLITIIFFSVNLIPTVSSLLSFTDSIGGKLDSYLEMRPTTLNFFGIISFLLKVGVWLLLLYLIRNTVTIYRFFVYFALFCTVMTFNYSVIFGRIQEYVNLVNLILILKVFSTNIKLKYIILICVIFNWSAIYTWKVAGTRSYRQYFPYASWLNPQEDIQRNNVIMELHKDLNI